MTINNNLLWNRRPDWINRIPYKQTSGSLLNSTTNQRWKAVLLRSFFQKVCSFQMLNWVLSPLLMRRRDQFHTIGYRDGLMAGREASAGFKQSVLVGHNWGVVRGVTR
ncbi:PROTEIN YAE1-like protein [Salix viminalis]|uniref:PROTEIN YAE1-like protein n=1 Tax=Salix viminalis TaxID=40686 RepID=A0A9Q0T689_SALVM|nr:PROTEIN YAE1-like protein [Salix viminalis]